MKIKRRPIEEITLGSFTFGLTGEYYWPLLISLDVGTFGGNITVQGHDKLNRKNTIALRDALTEIINTTKEQKND